MLGLTDLVAVPKHGASSAFHQRRFALVAAVAGHLVPLWDRVLAHAVAQREQLSQLYGYDLGNHSSDQSFRDNSIARNKTHHDSLLLLHPYPRRHIQKRMLLRIQNRNGMPPLRLAREPGTAIICIKRNGHPSAPRLHNEPQAEEVLDGVDLGEEAPVLAGRVPGAIRGAEKVRVELVLVGQVREVGEDGFVAEVCYLPFYRGLISCQNVLSSHPSLRCTMGAMMGLQ